MPQYGIHLDKMTCTLTELSQEGFDRIIFHANRDLTEVHNLSRRNGLEVEMLTSSRKKKKE